MVKVKSGVSSILILNDRSFRSGPANREAGSKVEVVKASKKKAARMTRRGQVSRRDEL